MAEIVGGLRARLIRDSLFHALHEGLGELGWFDVSRQHRPVQFAAEPAPTNTEIPLNTVALSDEDLSEVDLELGSNAVETSWSFYVDFYAENDVVGKHLINDVRDFLGGRMPDLDRVDSSIVVYDYRLATPAPVFVVQIENLVVDRAHDFPKPYQQHWYACSFEVRDAYGT